MLLRLQPPRIDVDSAARSLRGPTTRPRRPHRRCAPCPTNGIHVMLAMRIETGCRANQHGLVISRRSSEKVAVEPRRPGHFVVAGEQLLVGVDETLGRPRPGPLAIRVVADIGDQACGRPPPLPSSREGARNCGSGARRAHDLTARACPARFFGKVVTTASINGLRSTRHEDSRPGSVHRVARGSWAGLPGLTRPAAGRRIPDAPRA